MRIKKIHITGFGIHENVSWQLGHGMRVFFGLNERGKTTIAKFIEFILYGEDALGGKNAANIYEPAGRGAHGGFLEVESRGRSFTAARAFGKKNSLTVTDESGDSIPAADFETVLKHHVTRDNFASVFSIDVDDLAAIPDGGDALGGIFFDTLGSGAGISAQSARDRIRTTKNNIYTPNRKSQIGNRLFDLMQNLDKLRVEIEAGKSAAAEYERLARQRDDVRRRKERQDRENQEAAEHLREKKSLISLKPYYDEYKDALTARDAACFVKDFPADGLQKLESIESDISEIEQNLKENEKQAKSAEIKLGQIAFDPRWIQHEAEISGLYLGKKLMEQEKDNLAGDRSSLEAKNAEIESIIAKNFPGATREDIDNMGAGIPERGALKAAIEAAREAAENLRAQSDKLESLKNALRETDNEIESLDNLLQSAASVSEDMPPDEFRARLNDWRRAHVEVERLEQERAFAARSAGNAGTAPPRQPSSMPLIIGGLLLIVFGMLLALLKPAPGMVPGLVLAAMGAALLFLSLRAGSRARGAASETGFNSSVGGLNAMLEKARADAASALHALGLDSLDMHTADMLLQQLTDQQAKRRADHDELDRKKQKRERRAKEASDFESGAYTRARKMLEQSESALAELKARLRLPRSVAHAAAIEMQDAVAEIKKLFAERDSFKQKISSRSDELREYAQSVRDVCLRLDLSADDTADVFALLEILFKEFEKQRSAGAQLETLRKDAERIQKERDSLTNKYDELKSKFEDLLAAGGAPGDAAAFRERAQTFAAFKKAESDAASRRGALMPAKSVDEAEEAFLTRIQGVFDSGIEMLQSEARTLESQSLILESEREQTIREQAGIDSAIRNLLDQDELKSKEQEYASLLLELAELSKAWNRLALAERVMSMVAEEDEKNRMPDIKRDAAELFAAFTGGEYEGLRIDTAQRTVHALRDGMDVPVARLSRSVRHELYLALRFAQVLHLARAGAAPAETMPVLLDDVFVDIDDNRLPRVVRALAETFNPLKTQIIHFTAHEHIKDVFEEEYGEECIVLL